MLARFHILLATLAAVTLTHPARAAAPDPGITIGNCYSNDKCTTGEAPIAANPTKTMPFLATCKSFRSSIHSGSVCKTTSCTSCQDLSENACLKAGKDVWAQYCPIDKEPPTRELIAPRAARDPPKVVTIGNCYSDDKCSTGEVPITVDLNQQKSIRAKCKSFKATVQQGSLCDKAGCSTCKDLTTALACMKPTGQAFLSFCPVANNPPAALRM